MTKKFLIPTNEELNIILAMANHAYQSKMCDKHQSVHGIVFIMMRAWELGQPLIGSIMGGFNIINGKVELAPATMNAMIREVGHKLEPLIMNNEVCQIKGTRKGTNETCIVEYSMKDAHMARLIKPNGGWEKNPSDMLWARALSRLARRLFSDVISGCYVEGEIEDEGSNKNTIEAIQVSTHESVTHQPIDEKQVSHEAPEVQYIDEQQISSLNALLSKDEDIHLRISSAYGSFDKIPKAVFGRVVTKINQLISEKSLAQSAITRENEINEEKTV